MTRGRAGQTHRRENGHDHIVRHRPRGAAARRRRILLQTQGLSRKGGSLAGVIRPLTTRTPRSHGLSPALTRGVPPVCHKGHCARPCGGQSRSTTLRRVVDLLCAVVIDEPELPKSVHEEVDARARRSDLTLLVSVCVRKRSAKAAGRGIAYGIVHHFPGGTKEQYEATLAAVLPTRDSLPQGQTFHAAAGSAGPPTRLHHPEHSLVKSLVEHPGSSCRSDSTFP
jgi:hypothetical protein